jgi:hypothetical protein
MHPSIIESIGDSGNFNDEVDAKLKAVLDEFKQIGSW